ncbi:hypothetical protein MJO29_015484 [Puccinia striiformis f. sp. tritici]|uniref:Uncharacterized protein n=1 Tax=Puccinia striiformis f. sp. tritici PST-78 TaxID=1165861 RepID=A0A0L0UTY1_9BASI|nr:hypothetical protein Pst134EB_029758 [Puccinia striiformis f. sp. tritici]KAI7936181.1 hypothetical protein MJO29_015484 [Puccinia striiformis f. sp. tritici]KAI9617200.1 hypothetical protein H4Q26_013065 [Puccinia striiformis f. sp. tritici PST-130]KNE90502.1 hypothetical protein PSTG_16065 [Puccinia striiformis f. sp. tritici PST-78]
MLFLRVLLNFLVAGVAIASVVPAEKSGVSAPKSTGKRDVDEDGSGSVLFEYSSSVSVSIESKFGLIVDSCNSGKYQVVESALEEILHKFSDLNSQCHKGISFEFEEVFDFSHEFIKVLLKFQPILLVIKKHPLIADKCGATLFKCGYQLGEIFKFILSYKVDLASLSFSVGIDYRVFGGIGFSFPHIG